MAASRMRWLQAAESDSNFERKGDLLKECRQLEGLKDNTYRNQNYFMDLRVKLQVKSMRLAHLNIYFLIKRTYWHPD